MAMNERTEPAAGRGFRPGSRRRTRIAAGVTIAAIAVAGNTWVYASLNGSTEVVQFIDNVRAGELISNGDVRTVEIGDDITSANLVPADQIGTIVNQYARTFIPSGSLASGYLVQSDPLVGSGTAVVAVAPSGGLLPSGLTERSRVGVVVGEAPELLQVEGRVVLVDRGDDGATNLSVEVAEADAAMVASADDLHVVLLDPGDDPAIDAAGESGGDR